MKRTALSACLGAAALLAAVEPGRAGIPGSRHDFTGTSFERGGSCGACHRPHLGPGGPLLWSRDLTEEYGFFTQDGTPLPNYIPPATLLCYDCHDDNATAVPSAVDDDPPKADWSIGHEPQNVAFTDAVPSSPSTTPSITGYYELYDGRTPALGNLPAPGDPTGGHFWKREPNGVPDFNRGDKIACGLCHDPHNTRTGSNQVMFLTETGDGRGSLVTLVNGATASQNTRAGAPPGTGTGREMCAACHGYSFGDGNPKMFWDVDLATSRPPNYIPQHKDGNTVACTTCHKHNKVHFSCRDCHGFPPMEAAADDQDLFDRVDRPNKENYFGGAGVHRRHKEALGDAIFSCEICHGPNPGPGSGWHDVDPGDPNPTPGIVTQGRVNVMGLSDYWSPPGYPGGLTPAYGGSGAGPSPGNLSYSFSSMGGGLQRCSGVACHGNPLATETARLVWSGPTAKMVDEGTGDAVTIQICKWCHDQTPAKIGTGPYAPNVLGDGPSGTWSTGTWGADVNGHGHANGSYEGNLVGEATRLGVRAANKECSVCHDARYTTLALPAMNAPVKLHFNETVQSLRLRDTINDQPGIGDNADNTCLACHQVVGGPDSATDRGRVVSHGNSQVDGYKKWEEDNDFRRHCRMCHEPHGANWNGVAPNPRNLHMLGKWVDVDGDGQPDGGAMGNEAARVDSTADKSGNPDVGIDTNDLPVIVKSSGVGAGGGDNSWDDGNNDGLVPPDSICVVCHVSLANNHSQVGDSVPQGSGHLNVGAECRLCHQHGKLSTHPNGADDAFGPLSCFACHGVAPADTPPSGELAGQFWPSGAASKVPAFNYANNTKGGHRKHIEAISLQVFGEPASELVLNGSAANSTLTSFEKQVVVCWFCHYDPGGADTTPDPLPHFNDTNLDNSPLQRVDVKQGDAASHYFLRFTTGLGPYGRTNYAEDTTGGAYNFTTDSCANLVCHNQTPTPPAAGGTGTNFGWNSPPAWASPNNRCSNIDCHVTGTYTNMHATHVQAVASGGKFYPCLECHDNNVGNLAHGNGKIDMTWTNATSLEGSIGNDDGFYDRDVSGNASGGDTAFAYKSGTYNVTCNLVYCHGGDGTALGWGGADTTPVWDNAAPDSVYCGSCHDANASDAVNPGGLDVISTGNHTDHLTAAWGPGFANPPGSAVTSCLGAATLGCHTDYQLATTTHVDGSVQFDNLAASPATSLLGTQAVTTPTAEETDRCSYCHSTLSVTVNVAGPATVTDAGAALAKTNWPTNGYELPCLTCHNPAATAGSTFADGTGRKAPDELGNDLLDVDLDGKYLGYGAEVSGHNRAAADGNYALSANPAARQLCTECHDRTVAHIN
ncbi:MAG TPA: CxxxxCH/CxxCH domain-containing protein, partial [Candidatus Methanoperedens sp.]|nr:CxxxxCH/CxxCH domain-containing protein [Candidatus Methanoperedens sp.]